MKHWLIVKLGNINFNIKKHNDPKPDQFDYWLLNISWICHNCMCRRATAELQGIKDQLELIYYLELIYA